MGYYINPIGESKESWLKKHGTPIHPDSALSHKFDGKSYPVCLVDNGRFTAAAIAYCPFELRACANPDGRQKQWFKVEAELLIQWYNPQKGAFK